MVLAGLVAHCSILFWDSGQEKGGSDLFWTLCTAGGGSSHLFWTGRSSALSLGVLNKDGSPPRGRQSDQGPTYKTASSSSSSRASDRGRTTG
jgi:hypothetical protein